MEIVAAAVETAIAVPVEITIPVVIPIAPAEAEILAVMRIPVAHAELKRADAAATETADLPDRIFRILHRWTIRHFPEGMTEDVRPADVSRILRNKEPLNRQTAQGFVIPVKISWT